MCGIAGFLHLDGAPAEKPILERMARRLSHRGPDDEGFYLDGSLGLAHRRLSILDLSEAGHQPICNEDQSLWMVANGEIYNYIELRQQLAARGHKFRSHTDTEVILHLFEEEGPAALDRLNGMFAFVLWWPGESRLLAARDRFGIKPLYYHFDGRHFSFASEIKALLETGWVQPSMDPHGLSDYLTFQFCLNEKTLFRGVQKLEPGQFLTLEAGNLQTHTYWELDFTVDTTASPEYFEHTLARYLEDSVRIQLRSDVPVGAYLSGGLDSSTVSCLASSLLGGPLHVFCGAFAEPGYDESRHARTVADSLGAIYHEVRPGAQDFVDVLPRLIEAMDEPAAGPGLFPQYFVSRMAAQNVKVVLGGQGGDEIFGGYTRYLVAYLEECLKAGIEGQQQDSRYVVTLESIVPNLGQLKGYEPLLQQFWSRGMFESSTSRYFQLIDRRGSARALLEPSLFEPESGYRPYEAYRELFERPGTSSLINRMTRFDLATLLPALLQVEDRMSMAVSVESRIPLLDHRIAELVARMPPKIKYAGGRSKHIFRQVVKHMVPPSILERQDKMGFPVPLTEWYRTAPVRDFVHDILLGSRAHSRGFYHMENLERALREEGAYSRGIWGVLCLELWLRAFVDVPVGTA